MSLMMYSDMLKGKHAKLPPSQATRWATKNLTPDDIFRMIVLDTLRKLEL